MDTIHPLARCVPGFFTESGIKVNQTVLFGFGCAIFFIVLTGAFLYDMLTVREYADMDKSNSYVRQAGNEVIQTQIDSRQAV